MRRVARFGVFSFEAESFKALLAEVEIETVITLVSNFSNWKHATSITFDCLFYCLTWFHNDFNSMFFRVIVATKLQTFKGRGKVAILA